VVDSSWESSVVAATHEQIHIPELPDQNWPAYNEALKRRATLIIWFDPEMT